MQSRNFKVAIIIFGLVLSAVYPWACSARHRIPDECFELVPDGAQTIMVFRGPFSRLTDFDQEPQIPERLAFGSFIWLGNGSITNCVNPEDIDTAIEINKGPGNPTTSYDGCNFLVLKTKAEVAPFEREIQNLAIEKHEYCGRKIWTVRQQLEARTIINLFVCMVKPNVICCSTNPMLLQKIIDLGIQYPRGRKLSWSEFDEWHYVNTAAPFWGIRHAPATASNDRIAQSKPIDDCDRGLAFDCDERLKFMHLTRTAYCHRKRTGAHAQTTVERQTVSIDTVASTPFFLSLLRELGHVYSL